MAVLLKVLVEREAAIERPVACRATYVQCAMRYWASAIMMFAAV